MRKRGSTLRSGREQEDVHSQILYKPNNKLATLLFPLPLAPTTNVSSPEGRYISTSGKPSVSKRLIHSSLPILKGSEGKRREGGETHL